MSYAPDPTVLDLILARLIPWFLLVVPDNREAARRAALRLLGTFQAETDDELCLAAEIISLRLGSLEALSRSAEQSLSVSATLRLRGNANALNRAAHKTQAALEQLRRQRLEAEDPPEPEVAEADTATEIPAAAPKPQQQPLSRQQRRAMERAAEKARRQQPEKLRREARRAALEAAKRLTEPLRQAA
jgi:hypothetical protein